MLGVFAEIDIFMLICYGFRWDEEIVVIKLNKNDLKGACDVA